MIDVAQFLAACAKAGMLLSSACALFVVPPLIWLGVRRVAPLIEAMSDDPAWQAPLAALAASLPGASFATIAALTFLAGWRWHCLEYSSGRIVFAVVVGLSLLAIARASSLAIRRHREVALLLRHARVPSARLARIASALGVCAVEVDVDGSSCFLAGIRHPRVVVSTALLGRLSDAELRAALLHEIAHRDRLDQVLAAIVSFASDLLPLPIADLVRVYRHAREFAADERASTRGAALDLAGAILAVAHPCDRSLAAAAALGGEQNLVHARLSVLLSDDVLQPDRPRRLVVASLVTLIALGALAPLATAIQLLSCSA